MHCMWSANDTFSPEFWNNHFADDISMWIFLKENFNSIQVFISLVLEVYLTISQYYFRKWLVSVRQLPEPAMAYSKCMKWQYMKFLNFETEWPNNMFNEHISIKFTYMTYCRTVAIFHYLFCYSSIHCHKLCFITLYSWYSLFHTC